MEIDTADSKAKPKPQPEASEGHIMVIIRAPFKTYFDGEALSVSAVNETGPFDVLPKHHKFITLLGEGDIVVRTDKSDEKISINRGVMHVKENVVNVFLDI